MFDNVEAYHRPKTISEAIGLLNTKSARIIAGCTDAVVQGDPSVRVLIDITRAGLSYIRRRTGACVIGATTTMADLEDSSEIHSFADGVLARAAATCGSVQIKNVATIGGNLANASPAADLATPLVALDATVVVANGKGKRKLPLGEYLAKRPPKTLLIEVIVERPGGLSHWSFQKLGRTEVDISLVSVVAGLQLDTKGCVKYARIALGAVAPHTIRASEAEMLLEGRVLDRAAVAEAADAASRATSPISDVRASADYRREMSRVLTKRALEACAGRAL
jgi:carbon-monoxide dehydrogenase medium subunit